MTILEEWEMFCMCIGGIIGAFIVLALIVHICTWGIDDDKE